MKKQTKGAVAAGGAAVLLLGGLGSLAYWNDSENVPGGTITAGSLTIGTVSGTWSDNHSHTNLDFTSFRMVPGDVLTYTATVPVTANGTNLKAKLYADTAAVTGTLAPMVTTTIKSGGSSIIGSGSGVAIVVPAPASTTPVNVPVEVTITLPFGSTADNTSQNTSLDLAQMKLNVEQVA